MLPTQPVRSGPPRSPPGRDAGSPAPPLPRRVGPGVGRVGCLDRPLRGCPRSCRRSGAVRDGTMIHPPLRQPRPGGRQGLRVRLWRAVVVRAVEFASGKRERTPEKSLGKTTQENLESLRLPQRPRLTESSGARLLFPLQTCELLAGPRRRRDFAGPDGPGRGGADGVLGGGVLSGGCPAPRRAWATAGLSSRLGACRWRVNLG